MATNDPPPLGLFEGYGVEVEYMIVDAATLDVMPVADELIRAVCGSYESEIELGDCCWSNELMSHVVELKTNGPAPSLEGLAEGFHAHVRRMNALLQPMGARLMPAAMHPWMNPDAEAKLWPHEYSAVFEAFDRIFGCKGHGWANLQSAHLNLPFRGDEEFARLHAAVRLVLPLLPALAAASPVADGRLAPWLDYRMEVYRTNALRIPSMTGAIVPEPSAGRAEYERDILGRLYEDLAPHDPAGELAHEWCNSRGAIARFMRNTIEVRVIDAQECPAADLAIAALASETIRGLVEERWASYEAQLRFPGELLVTLLRETTRIADEAPVDSAYARVFGVRGAGLRAGDLWRRIYDGVSSEAGEGVRAVLRPAETLLAHGPLARRIVRALAGDFSRPALARVYGGLCDALEANTLYAPTR